MYIFLLHVFSARKGSTMSAQYFLVYAAYS